MRRVQHIGLVFAAVLVAWGCNENSTKPQPKQSHQMERGQSHQEENVQTPVQEQQQRQQQAPATGEPDAYGRMPGDAHYGHDHPLLEEELNNQSQQGSPVQQGTQIQQGSPVQTQQAAPTSGEPDKYGRLPGDEHYGHDHP